MSSAEHRQRRSGGIAHTDLVAAAGQAQRKEDPAGGAGGAKVMGFPTRNVEEVSRPLDVGLGARGGSR